MKSFLYPSCGLLLLGVAGCCTGETPRQCGLPEVKEATAAIPAANENSIPLNVLFEECFQNGQPTPKYMELYFTYLKSRPLPEHPTESDITQFLSRLAMGNMFTRYSSYPQSDDGRAQMQKWVKLQLDKVPTEILLSSISVNNGNGFPQDYLSNRLTAADKPQLFAYLTASRNGGNVLEIYKKFITDQDRDNIIALLPTYSTGLSDEIRRFGLQKEAFVHLNRQLNAPRYNTYSAGNPLALCLEFCPKAEFDTFCDEYLRSSIMRNNDYNGINDGAVNAAIQMAKAGSLKSFQYLLIHLKDMKQENHSHYIRSVLALTPCKTQDEAIAWFAKNRDNIRFDNIGFCYVVVAAKAPDKSAATLSE